MKGVQISVIFFMFLVVSTFSYRSRIIIIEDAKACFRRAFAGKRVMRALIRRTLACEKVEECQQECAEEKRFLCEGFNYRLDRSGRGNGDCELLDLPIVRLDVRRETFSDPDYDVYERDRNGASDCKGYRYRPRDVDRRYDRVPYDRRPFYDDRRIGERRGDGYYYSDRHDYHHRYHDKYLPEYLPKPPMDKYYFDRERDRNYWGLNKWGSYGGLYGNFGKPATLYGDINRFDYGNIHRFDYGNRRQDYLPNKVGGNRDWGAYGGSYGTGGYSYGSSYKWGISHEKGYNYDKPNTGLNYLPAKPSYEGYSYGSSYGTGSHNYEISKPSYELSTPNYGPSRPSYEPPRPIRPHIYELSKPHSPPLPTYDSPRPGYGLPPSFDPARPPTYGVSKPVIFEVSKPPILETGYNYPKPSTGRPRPNFENHRPHFGQPKPNYNYNIISENHFYSGSDDVVEHKNFGRYDFLKDECSLRTATGFRLHKIIVKKLFSVPDIYECEMLCVKERDFECLSYAYRYTTNLNAHNDNCYLSNRNYKELDFYTDLEPDRDFDIYTMNNIKKCVALPRRNELSDCFWHTRSGQRLDYKVVRDSMNVKSVADCQAECIRSRKFLCRAFSFRYGSSIIGGSIDNCQLTDWPFMELDPRSQLVPEYGFEIYERGSFGYGCEPNHFSIRGKDHPVIGAKTDQLCYIGYGTPARLLPQAIRKSLYVNSELDCKIECTKTRHETLFQCMSFSFRTKYHRGETNCDLSDILQRDLLTNVDYVYDPDTWLFAWDNYNPECVVIANVKPISPPKGPTYLGRDENMDISRYGGYDSFTALDTWRVYSVSGWPCRRGSSCRENREAGFWYCELEGGDADTWDYCCRPDHQCGYSEGFPYQWCHVGPRRTQWRKCSDRYYPYIFNLIDRHDFNPIFRPKPYLPDYSPQYDAPPFITGKPTGGFTPHPGFRPDRPPPSASPLLPPRKPSLNEYEQEFNKHFLDPPKPGGFGQPRHWPVSYLHREMPPHESNITEYKFDKMKMEKRVEGNRRNVAIQNLIEIIKSKDINNIQYQIANQTDKTNDILLVKIPLPTNFTEEKTEKAVVPEDALSKPIDIEQSKVPTTTSKIKDLGNTRQSRQNIRFSDSDRAESFLVRRGFVERTNVTRRGFI